MNALRTLVVLWIALVALPSRAAELEIRREIAFPDLPGYRTLACDLHMHTVFSDGNVWPTVRVNEAWRQGLHAIAIADHIEYQPHKDDVPTHHGRSHDLAANAARSHNLLLIKAAEITRDTPPGHFNALFLDDIRPLDTPDFLDALRQAHQQGAFVFWNHQGWKGEEKGAWLDVHQTLYDNKWFQGMEVANGDEYYPTAHQWCLDKGLTLLGNTDIHDPDLRRESSPQDHRTMTLVLAREATPAAIREALLAGRTIVWFKDQLIGREELLRPFGEKCLEVRQPNVRTKTHVYVEVRNVCQADLCLEPCDQPQPKALVVPARSTALLKLPLGAAAKPLAVRYTLKNFRIAPQQNLTLTLTVPD